MNDSLSFAIVCLILATLLLLAMGLAWAEVLSGTGLHALTWLTWSPIWT